MSAGSPWLVSASDRTESESGSLSTSTPSQSKITMEQVESNATQAVLLRRIPHYNSVSESIFKWANASNRMSPRPPGQRYHAKCRSHSYPGRSCCGRTDEQLIGADLLRWCLAPLGETPPHGLASTDR